MTTQPTTTDSQRGLTLVETMVSVAILVPTLVVIFSMHPTLSKSFTTNLGAASAENRSAANLDRVCTMLRGSSLSAVECWDGTAWVAPADSIEYEAIRFRSLLRLPNSGAPSLGPVRTLEFVPAQGEPRNGVDDDRDGVVDDGVLRLTDAAGLRTLIASDVERFTVARNNRNLVVELTVATRDATRAVHRRTRRIDLLLRNN